MIRKQQVRREFVDVQALRGGFAVEQRLRDGWFGLTYRGPPARAMSPFIDGDQVLSIGIVSFLTASPLALHQILNETIASDAGRLQVKFFRAHSAAQVELQRSFAATEKAALAAATANRLAEEAKQRGEGFFPFLFPSIFPFLFF